MNELTVMDMALAMGCFVFALAAVIVGILLFVREQLNQSKKLWIPAIVAVVLGILSICLGLHFIHI